MESNKRDDEIEDINCAGLLPISAEADKFFSDYFRKSKNQLITAATKIEDSQHEHKEFDKKNPNL